MKLSNNKIGIIFGSVMVIVVMIIIAVTTLRTNQETKVTFSDQYFTIKGMYGDQYNYADINLIELKDTLPEITNKTNGAALGKTKKGYFDVTGLGNCILFLFENQGPYLYLKIHDKYIIMNFKDADKTKQLYDELSGRVKLGYVRWVKLVSETEKEDYLCLYLKDLLLPHNSRLINDPIENRKYYENINRLDNIEK